MASDHNSYPPPTTTTTTTTPTTTPTTTTCTLVATDTASATATAATVANASVLRRRASLGTSRELVKIQYNLCITARAEFGLNLPQTGHQLNSKPSYQGLVPGLDSWGMVEPCP